MRRNSLAAWVGLAVLWGASGAASAAGEPRGFLRIDADDPLDSLRDTSLALQDIGRHLTKIAAATTPSVVHILAEHDGRSGTLEETGSGVLLTSPKGKGVFVVTNRHVIADAKLKAIKIHLSDGRIIYPTGKFDDPATDVAVLLIGAPNTVPARWGDSDNLDIGHLVLAMGSPFGLSQSITLGIVSAKGRRSLQLGNRKEVINQDFLQTDAAINPGNSGGPLIDMQGRIVGINTAIASQGGGNEGIGFSIPINLVRYVVDRLLEDGRVRRGFLGVRLDDKFDEVAARRFGLDRPRGARVVEIYQGTPAAIAGVRVDDVIVNFDGMSIDDENHLIHLVSLTEVERTVRLIVLREGREVTLQITLTERPDQGRSEAPPAVPPAGGGARFETTGLLLHRIDAQIAAQSGYAFNQRGLLVLQAPPGEDADTLRLYDVIEEVARSPVAAPADFDAALAAQAPGPVLLKVRRIVDGLPVTRLVVWSR
jgi:serine protease Do